MKYIDNVYIAYDNNKNKFVLVKLKKDGKISQERILKDDEINQFLNTIYLYQDKFNLDLLKYLDFCAVILPVIAKLAVCTALFN